MNAARVSKTWVRDGRRRFPPPESADEQGIVCLGGELASEWLLEAYSQGIFPWPFHDARAREILAWFSPDPRAVLEWADFHASRRLLRRLRRREFQPTCDQAFREVIQACAQRGPDAETWITPRMQAAYEDLHARGYAHSIEVWSQDRLVGGVYGVALGSYFSAESMFHRRPDASKAALFFLVQHLRCRGFQLLDVQIQSPHLASLGATEIRRRDFLRRLKTALATPASLVAGTLDATATPD